MARCHFLSALLVSVSLRCAVAKAGDEGVKPFNCEAHPLPLQLICNEKGEANCTLSELNITTGEYSPIYSFGEDAVPGFPKMKRMNAIGLNPKDSKFYGSIMLGDGPDRTAKTYLCRFGEGKIEILGRMPGIVIAGGFHPDSHTEAFYYKADERGTQKIYEVTKLSEAEAHSKEDDAQDILGDKVVTIEGDDRFQDIVVLTTKAEKLGNRTLLLGLFKTGNVYVLDVEKKDQWVMNAKNVEGSTDYGAGWLYEGHVYFGMNSGKGIVQLHVDTIDYAKKEMDASVYAEDSAETSSNDGANCLQESDPFDDLTTATTTPTTTTTPTETTPPLPPPKPTTTTTTKKTTTTTTSTTESEPTTTTTTSTTQSEPTTATSGTTQGPCEDRGIFEVRDKSHCYGQEVEQGSCPDLPPCEECDPVDCEFGSWGDWNMDHGDCSGLKVRKREITTQENECGKPCDGPLTETAEHIDKSDTTCFPPEQLCEFSEWADWSQCTTPSQQKYRHREFSYTTEKTPGKHVHAIEDCDKEVLETAPCSYADGKVPENCKFNSWGGWTECSTSCNIGWKSRSRTFDPPVNGGEPCNGTLRESEMCNQGKAKQCEPVNCKFGQWSAWSGCNAESPYSKSRTRTIDTPSANGGTECAGATEETECCDFMIPSDCKMSDWSDWGTCSPQDACGAQGQSFRTRRVLSEPFNGGSCPDFSMQETKPCPLPECKENKEDCKLKDWEDWEPCSITCGQGEKVRKRGFQEATGEGYGCTGNLTEVAACGTPGECDKTDCKWHSWSSWSDCTVTCGNGTKTRSRNIAVSPRNGGAFCPPEVKREAAQCNVGDCKDDCVNGTWSDWTDYTECSTSCGPGYQSRHRHIAKQPNECGTPATGASEEFIPCNVLGKDACNTKQDCELAAWNEWGDCSASCFGHAFRNREVKAYARYGGKPCNESLRDVTSCNPGPGDEIAPKGCVKKEKEECEFKDWSEWTKCTNCGGGYQRRDRVISNRPCQLKAGETETLIETHMCPVQDCPKPECTDCTWSAWSEWSACSHCGDQKRRSRYVSSSANYCGKPCNQSAAVELAQCDSPCEDFYYCEWDHFYKGPCTSSCGPAVKSLERHLVLKKGAKDKPVGEYLFKGFKESKCAGVQKTWETCDNEPCPNECEPENCALSEWSEWGDLGGGCMGLCQRNRGIEKINNKCGKPCNDTLTETKVCENKCNKTVDCEFCDWSEWTVCYSDFAQSTRVRSPIGCKDPACGGGLARGKVCSGPLKETRPCKTGSRDVNCEFADWEAWGKCTVTCGGGRQQRDRFIKTAAEGIGAGCSGNMSEVQDCETQKCSTIDQDCKMTDWSEWQDHCDKDNQKTKLRNITQASVGAGTPCKGNLMETTGCQPKVVNCEMSDWSEWAECDRTCGGGQRKKERIPKVLPMNGGEACPPEIQFIEACNTKPCDPNQDCEFADWSEWSECTRKCGGGQRNKTRSIAHEAQPAGAGCTGTMKEVEGCGIEPCTKDVDCEWGEWNDWSACSVSCGGGTHRRHRRIKTFPVNQGKKCAAEDKEEIAPCKEEQCQACKDGTWGDWSKWTHCTATCGQGVQWRHRDVHEMANECGAEPVGLNQELRECTKKQCKTDLDIDCELQDWGDWHGCSAECNGYRRRVRDIATNGAGNGDFCQAEKGCKPLGGKTTNCTPASLEEFEGCNQESAKCKEDKEPDVNCVFSDWSEWDCPVTCGRGQAVSSRTIKTPASGEGKPCNGEMKRTAKCQGPEGGKLASCSKEDDVLDCEYDDWSEWGDCTKCAGQKFRSRDIKQQAQNGGIACMPNATRETMGCDHRECGKPHFCTWEDWKDWSSCDKSCGSGKRQRKRHLELTSKKVLSDKMQLENADLQHQLDAQRDAHLQQVVLAFSAGAACLVFAAFVFRLRQGPVGRPRRPSFEHGAFE